MNLEINGTIQEIREEVQVTESFKKREFILHSPDLVNPQYSDVFKIELHQANTTKIDGFNIGDNVICQCNLQGREFTKKDGSGTVMNFTSLSAWKIEAGEQTQHEEPEDLPFV